jgi:hypothetical protein
MCNSVIIVSNYTFSQALELNHSVNTFVDVEDSVHLWTWADGGEYQHNRRTWH